jgi:hypothetical protein
MWDEKGERKGKYGKKDWGWEKGKKKLKGRGGWKASEDV